MTELEYRSNINLLNHYTMMYDKGTPEISDKAWDQLYFECKQFEKETGIIDPTSPTASIQYDDETSSTGKLKKVTHDHLMLSLAKTKVLDDLKKWCGTKDILAMLKCDGLTCSLRYENGILVKAETRGNGKVGEDVLESAKRIKSIPKTINYKDTLVVDGEVLCKYDDFKEFEDEYSNPRNFASGSLGLDDYDEVERRNLTFVVWDKISGEEDLSDKLDILDKLGFFVVPREKYDPNNVEEQQERMRLLATKMNIPIDGLVYKINNYKNYMALGYNEHDFAGGLAFKFYDQEYQTELIDIKWTVGKTGRITPTAIFKTVKIDGANISQACMHNLTIMEKLLGKNPYVGQIIYVIRANMVIPQVSRAEIS